MLHGVPFNHAKNVRNGEYYAIFHCNLSLVTGITRSIAVRDV